MLWRHRRLAEKKRSGFVQGFRALRANTIVKDLEDVAAMCDQAWIGLDGGDPAALGFLFT